jgi:DNA polymerase III subunit delta
MVAVKPWEVDRFVARPDPGKPIVLVYGADLGLVHERTDALIAGAVDDRHDPFSLARIDGDALAEEPERLVEEAHTVPLFGGRRAVWVKAGSKNFTAAVERVLATPPSSDCRIVIEAGELRRASPLRSLCERATNAAVLACYPDDSKAVDRLIDEELRGAGLSIAADARVMLNGLLGGDRGASRSELRKLILYADGANRIETADIAAIVADATAPAVDDVIDAAFAGRPGELETGFSRARSGGVAAATIALMASRHVAMLHRLRLAVESGTSVAAVVDGAPMLHLRRKAAAQSALQLWNAQRLARLIGQLGDAVLETRKQPQLADAIVQRALLSIAVSARRKE